MERQDDKIVYNDAETVDFKVSQEMTIAEALDTASELRQVAEELTASAVAYQADADGMPDGLMAICHQHGISRAAKLMCFVTGVEKRCVPELAARLFGEYTD